MKPVHVAALAAALSALWWIPGMCAPAATPTPGPDEPPPRPTAAAAIDRVDLAAYVDGLVDAGREREGIAGVAVSIVDRDGPLLLRGYGIASSDPLQRVSPETTLFRIASISKTFTYLLALDLIDEGRLDLDQPVNAYLPASLQLPEDGFAPVRVRHLFTHTAGYEDSALGHLFVDSAERVRPAHEYLQRHRPERVREPGLHAVYSNYSVALLGALVAHVHGVGFDALAERELFAPMGMRLTTFGEPLPADDSRNVQPRFKGLWSSGFQRSGGGFKPQVFEYIAQIAPAGGASSTAADMGRYMRMLLNEGQLDGVQVLSPSAYARLSGEPLFRNAPEVGGFSYGFFDNRFGAVRALGHGGATSWFHSSMTVVPELGIGIFVSTNTDTGRRFAPQVAEKVLERYFPQARQTALPVIPVDFDAARFAGRYVAQRTNFSSAEKAFLTSLTQVAAAPDRSLVLTANGIASRWVPESPTVFREAEGPGRIAFLLDDAGAVTGFAAALGHNVSMRAGFFDVSESLAPLIGVAAVVSMLVLTGAWLRRRRAHAGAGAMRSARWLYATAGAWLVLGVLTLLLMRSAHASSGFFYGYPGPLLTILLWWSPAVIGLSAVNAAMLVPAWRGQWPAWRKLRHSAAVAVFVLAAWMLWHWNLVGWKL
ncbi:MAG TPA: serine hydrolase domain-containing protein [Lysobacter sp.]|nr:serine hydrolase domain-containing protein [Lysobacter sp.]